MADQKAILEAVYEIANATRSIDRLKQEHEDATRAMQRAIERVDFDPTTEEARDLQEQVVRTGKALTKAARQNTSDLKNVTKAADALDKEIDQVGKTGQFALSKLKGLGAAVAAAFTVDTITRFVRSSVEARIELDRYRNALLAVTGSQKEADREFEFAEDLANRLGIEVGSTADSYTRWIAASKGSRLEGEKGRAVFVAVAEAVKATGGGAEQTRGALTALEQIVSKTIVSTEELQQLSEGRIPGAFRIAAEAIREEGESIEEANIRLRKLLATGKLAADDFLPKFASALQNGFGGKRLEAAISSTESGIVRLQNTLKTAQAEFAEGFTDELVEGLDLSTESLNRFISVLGTAGSGVGEFLSRELAKAQVLFAFASGMDEIVQSLKDFDVEGDKAGADLARLLLDLKRLGTESTLSAKQLDAATADIIFALDAVKQSGKELSDQTTRQVVEAVQAMIDRYKAAEREVPPALLQIVAANQDVADSADRARDSVNSLALSATKFEQSAAAAAKLRTEAQALAEAFAIAEEHGDALQLEILAQEAESLAKQFESLDQTVPPALQAIRAGSEEALEPAEKLRKSFEGVGTAIERAGKAQQQFNQKKSQTQQAKKR